MLKVFLLVLIFFASVANAENNVESFSCETRHTVGVRDDKGVNDLAINRDIKVVKIAEGAVAVDHPKLAPVLMQILPSLPLTSEKELRFSSQFMNAVGYDRESSTVVALVIVAGEAAYTLNIGSMAMVIQAKCAK